MKLILLLLLLAFSIPVYADYSSKPELILSNDDVFKIHSRGKNVNGLVILLGGGPGFTSWNLEPIQNNIAKQGFEVILMDMWGIGENKHINRIPVIQNWIDQIDQTIVGKNSPRNIHLVGHSWGALMALNYSTRGKYAKKIVKTILLNPVDPEKLSLQPITEEIHRVSLLRKPDSGFGTSDWEQHFEAAPSTRNRKHINRVLPAYFFDYDQGLDYAKQFGDKDFDIELNVRVWSEYDKNRVSYKAIKKSQSKYYFMECKDDLLMPHNLNEMSAKMHLEKIVILEKCKHFPWIENETRFYQELNSILLKKI